VKDGRAQRTLRFDCVSPFLMAVRVGLRVPFVCNETNELVEELVGSSLHDYDRSRQTTIYIRVERMVYLLDRSDFQPGRIFAQHRPTGSAMPLMWAHAEYIKLLRSVSDGHVFDLIPDVAKRYLGDRKSCQLFEIWKPNRMVRVAKARLYAARPSSSSIPPPLDWRRVAYR
jgi:hypothetical protein